MRCSSSKVHDVTALRFDRSLRRITITLGILTVQASIVAGGAPADAAGERPPRVPTIDNGARVDDVSIETYGGFRFNLAYGNQGGRITYEVLGQLF